MLIRWMIAGLIFAYALTGMAQPTPTDEHDHVHEPPSAQQEEALSQEEQTAIINLFENDEIQKAVNDSLNQSSSAPIQQQQNTTTLNNQNNPRMVNPVNRYIPNVSVITDVALGYYTGDTPLQTGSHDPNKSGFTLQQVELHIQDAVDPFFNYSTNIVFSLFGVEVEEAYLFTARLPWGFQMRAGQFLQQIGRLNPTHPHSWSFVDQPMMNGTLFGSEGARGLGLELSYLIPLPWFAEATYSFSQPGGACCGSSYIIDGARSLKDLSEFIHTARLGQFFALDDSWSILLGLNYQTGENGTGANNMSEIAGVDAYIRYRPVTSSQRVHLALQHETFSRRQQRPGRLLRDQGQYTSLEWKYNLRESLGLRYETVRPHEEHEEWETQVYRTSLAYTYYPSHFSRLRFQGSHRRVNGADGFGIVANIEVVIGSHGAHDF